MNCYRYRVLRLVRETYSVEVVADTQPTKEAVHDLAHDPANIEIRSWSVELMESNPVPPNPDDEAPPVAKIDAHPFQPVEGNRFCGKCGAGRLHKIHPA